MGFGTFLAKKTFNKIFNNLATELTEPVNNIKIGIYYPNGECKYEVYRGMVKEKDILLDDYTGMAIDFTGGSAAIEMTIGQAGQKYAKELSQTLGRVVEPSEISVIMKHEPDKLPLAVLFCSGTKQRLIDIEKEFLT